MPVSLMYDTHKTNGEKESNQRKRSTIDQTQSLTNPPKRSKRNAHAESTPIRQQMPHLHSMPVSLMYDTTETNGEKESKWRKRSTTEQNQPLTLSPKTPKRNAHAISTPVRQHYPHLHSMPVSLMYDTSKTNGEKESNQRKRSTTDQTHLLTSLSDSIILIYIR